MANNRDILITPHIRSGIYISTVVPQKINVSMQIMVTQFGIYVHVQVLNKEQGGAALMASYVATYLSRRDGEGRSGGKPI